MWINCLRVLTALSIFLCVSSPHAQNKAVVIPFDENFMVVPLPSGFVLDDPLTNGKSSGRVIGGSFSSAGWKHSTDPDKIIWDLGETMEAGIIEFEHTGMGPNTKGGTLHPGYERAYYFGFYNDSSGNKGLGGTNPAFIEVRYNWGRNYANISAIKFQAGDAGLAGNFHEPYGRKRWRDWDPNRYYKNKITFGDGLATLYIDDEFQAQIRYTNRPLGWRYLFLGDINYTIGGPENITYRNVRVTKIK